MCQDPENAKQLVVIDEDELPDQSSTEPPMAAMPAFSCSRYTTCDQNTKQPYFTLHMVLTIIGSALHRLDVEDPQSVVWSNYRSVMNAEHKCRNSKA